MKRTLKFLSLLGVASAAGVAAARRILPRHGDEVAPPVVQGLPSVSQELRQALNRFEERFGA